ncbi:MAG: MerR family transcriptional regulator [Alphaproteobacteria bacterium]|nr:MerR family transcriptional regulator [Alphaproteobacteria bacterium]MBL7099989.1 MerR family transcriptional regulator [Alphaproteobacteria bacterium]
MPQHVLRFWEGRFAQIKPVKRAGGRRYYRPEDVDLLRGIRMLLYREGFTIKGVQKILKERGHRHVIELGRGETMPIIPTGPNRPKPERVARDPGDDLFSRPSNVIPMERLAEAVSEPIAEEPVAEAATEEPGIESEIEAAACELQEAEAVATKQGLSEANRVKLEVLLGELLQMKARLKAG